MQAVGLCEDKGPSLSPDSPSLCGPRQPSSEPSPELGRQTPDPRPGSRRGTHPTAHSAPSRPPGRLSWEHRPGCSRQLDPATFPPGPHSFKPHQVGSPAARAQLPAPWPRPRLEPSSRHPRAPGSDGQGRASPAPATVGVRGAAPQSLRSGGLRHGAPPDPRSRQPAAHWTLRALSAPPQPLRPPLQVPPGPLSAPSPASSLGPLPARRAPTVRRARGAGPAGRAGAQLAAQPGCRKCQKTDPTAFAEGGSGQAGGGRRWGEGGGRGGRKTRAGSAALERAHPGPQSLPGARPFLAPLSLTH